MLPEEFYERTKVQLTGEEYKEVEAIYNSVQMDKDEFCKLWLENRDNKIIAELMCTIKKLEDDCQKLRSDSKTLTEEMEQLKASHKAEVEQDALQHRNEMDDLGRRIIRASEYSCLDSAIYDVLEEEFGIGFIIKTKHDANMELEDKEIDYMVSKL